MVYHANFLFHLAQQSPSVLLRGNQHYPFLLYSKHTACTYKQINILSSFCTNGSTPYMLLHTLPFSLKKTYSRASLVAQWIRVCLPMQGTWVWSLVQEDPPYQGATSLCASNCWVCMPRACDEKPPQWEATAMRSLHNEENPLLSN